MAADKTGIHADVTREIIGAAIEVHRHLGPGLLESFYEECLAYELSLRDIPHRRQVELPALYKDLETAHRWRADLIVDDTFWSS